MEEKSIPLRCAIYQILAACIAQTLSIQAGINMAYTTILLSELMPSHNADNSTNATQLTNATNLTGEFIVDKEQGSWIVSLVTITTPVGSLITGPLIDRFGRKTICALTTIPSILSWALIVLTTNSVYMIYIARVLAGISGGLSTAALVYTSEISHATVRPMLLSLTSVFVAFGILITTVLGYYLTWRTVAICCGLMAATSFTIMMFIPESPAWLVGVRSASRDEGFDTGLKLATRSLRWLYRREEDYQKELESLMKIKEKQNALKHEPLFEKLGDSSQNSKPNALKPLLVLLVLFTFQQFSGGYVVIFYAVQIFEKIGSVNLDQMTSVILLGLIRFIMALISLGLSRYVGRRPLLISSGIGMAASMISAAVYIHFVGVGTAPVACVLLFVLFSSYGMLVIPWCLIGELLPLHFRGKGSGLVIAAAYVLMFVTVKLFIYVLDQVVLVFGVFGGFSFLAVLFVYFKIPETFRKTFEEIEKSF